MLPLRVIHIMELKEEQNNSTQTPLSPWGRGDNFSAANFSTKRGCNSILSRCPLLCPRLHCHSLAGSAGAASRESSSSLLSLCVRLGVCLCCPLGHNKKMLQKKPKEPNSNDRQKTKSLRAHRGRLHCHCAASAAGSEILNQLALPPVPDSGPAPSGESST